MTWRFSSGRALPLPHLHRHWAHPCRICTGTGLAPPTSAPGPGLSTGRYLTAPTLRQLFTDRSAARRVRAAGRTFCAASAAAVGGAPMRAADEMVTRERMRRDGIDVLFFERGCAVHRCLARCIGLRVYRVASGRSHGTWNTLSCVRCMVYAVCRCGVLYAACRMLYLVCCMLCSAPTIPLRSERTRKQHSRRTRRVEGPGADVAGVSPVQVQMWQG